MQYVQYTNQGNPPDSNARCMILEELLFHKLLLNQAQLDSVEVTDSQVESEIDRRIRYFIHQIGSQEKLEEHYQKSINQIKEDFRDLIKEQLLTQSMQGKITADVKVTPADVRAYFNTIPTDSLPFISAEVEIGQIVKKPKVNEEAKQIARDEAEELRQRILNGEGFEAIAVMYSDDPGSATNGGDLGFFERGQMVPEFDVVAFRLKGTAVSEVFETQFGFHFMQLITRRGEKVNVRHILIQPKVSQEDMNMAKYFLDSIYHLIMLDSMKFADAAQRFSEDEESRNNGGLILNAQTGSTVFDMESIGQIDPTLFREIENMKPGDIANPAPMKTNDGKQAFRILMLKTMTEPHRANLKDDYQKIQNMALNIKQSQIIGEWIAQKITSTHIRVDEEYIKCEFDQKWKN